MKIPGSTRLTWIILSLVSDFVSAAFLMLGLGALGIHWDYWHAWWITFTVSAALGTVTYPIVARLEYLIERPR